MHFGLDANEASAFPFLESGLVFVREFCPLDRIEAYQIASGSISFLSRSNDIVIIVFGSDQGPVDVIEMLPLCELVRKRNRRDKQRRDDENPFNDPVLKKVVHSGQNSDSFPGTHVPCKDRRVMVIYTIDSPLLDRAHVAALEAVAHARASISSRRACSRYPFSIVSTT